MLRNYLTIAFRNLRKHKLYTFITIGGLAVALAACLLILLFVRDEMSYDRWLPNADRIAKLEITFNAPGREPMEFAQTPGPAKPALDKDFSSDIERVVRIYVDRAPLRAGDKLFSEHIAYVDRGFFDVFDLPIASGQREQALANNTSLLLSETMAHKYFGDESPLGKVITVDNKTDYTVVGVFKDLPHNTHLDLDFIAWFDVARYEKRPWIAKNWTSANLHTYVLFRSKAAMARVESELPAFTDRNVVLNLPGFDQPASSLVTFDFMPLLDIHLHARKNGYFKPGGDITTVITFSIIALLILLIACINFVNLATARSLQRAREVAMRKVVGATRKQLIGQFLGEAVLTATLAMVIAVALVEVSLGTYNSLVDKDLTLNLIGDPSLVALMVGLIVIVGVVGGSYPAIYLSRFRPARVLKANQYSSGGTAVLRNVLVVFQFAVSIGLIVSTAIVYEQTNYARNIDLGFDSNNKLVFSSISAIPGKNPAGATLKRELKALPGVTSATLASDAPPLSSNNNTLLYPHPTPTGKKLVIETLRVDYDFFAVHNIKPLAGRLFSADHPSDELAPLKERGDREPHQAIVVNQTFLTKLGVDSPQQAIGRDLWDIEQPGKKPKMVRTTIIGVVPDMHLRSVRVNITPLLFYVRNDKRRVFSTLTVSVKPGMMSETLAASQKIWDRLAPGLPMRTFFVDQKIAKQYDAIEKRAKIFAAFALFAVLVACLGLFGLAAFAAERRTKEIGMRKALGASVMDIVRLLLWQFSRPVLIANIIAWPAAFYLMRSWLGEFKYHLDLSQPSLLVPVFAGAGLVALVIAWSTVASHAARVARASPIHALRCE